MIFLKNIRYLLAATMMLFAAVGHNQTVIPQCAMLGSTGSVNSTGANTYQVLVNTTDFTAICNGTDVDPLTGQWAMWTTKSNGCNRYQITNATTTATQILIDVVDTDANGAPSNDFCAIIQEDDPCAVADFVASGGVFSLQSHNQCFSSYYKKLCAESCCGGGVVGQIVVDDDADYFTNKCIGGETEYYDLYAHGLVSTPCTDSSTPSWTITASSGASNVSISTVGIISFDPAFGTGFIEGVGTCDDTASDTWRVDFVCASPTQCDPDSLFFLDEVVDCVAGTAQVCFTICGERAGIYAIEGVIGYDDTKLSLSGISNVYATSNPVVNTSTSGIVSYVYSNGVGPTLPNGTIMFCADFNIIGDVSQGTTVQTTSPGSPFPDNKYTLEDPPLSLNFVSVPYELVPLSINCPSPLIFGSQIEGENRGISKLSWLLIISLIISLVIICMLWTRKSVTLVVLLLCFGSAIAQDGITSAGGGGGGEIPNNELLISVINTGTGLQLVDAGGTYVLPFSNFPFTANGMFDATNEGGTWTVENWTTAINPSLETLGANYTIKVNGDLGRRLIVEDYGSFGTSIAKDEFNAIGWSNISETSGFEASRSRFFNSIGLARMDSENASSVVSGFYTSAANAFIQSNAIGDDIVFGMNDQSELVAATELWSSNGGIAGSIPNGWVLTKIGDDVADGRPIVEWQAGVSIVDTYLDQINYAGSLFGHSWDFLDDSGNSISTIALYEGLGINLTTSIGGPSISVDVNDLLSTNAGQTATIGTDGKILVTGGAGTDTYIVNNALNVAGTTSDFGLIDNNATTQTNLSFFEGNGINYIDNLGRLEIEVDEAEILSTDANNSILLGSDGKLYSPATNELYIDDHTLNVGGTTSDFALEDNTGATQTSLSFLEGLGIDFTDNLGRLEIAIAIADLISADTPNGITASATDGKLIVQPSALKSYEFQDTGGGLITNLKTEGGFQIEAGRVLEVYVNGALVTGWTTADGGDADTLHDTLIFATAINNGDAISVVVQ